MAGRGQFLRIAALAIGMLVFLAHTMTLHRPGVPPDWLAVDYQDLVYHSTALSLFSLTYRFSFPRGAPGGAAFTILLCSTWGALCEISQHWIPARDFSVIELGVNILTPIVITALVALFRLR